MIITRLCGGLGNQMFQYALGRHLAHTNNTVLNLDLSWFERDSARTYDLEPFNIDARICSDHEIKKTTSAMHATLHGLFVRWLSRTNPLYSIKEKHSHYDPEVLLSPDNTYLDGYWQSENYFSAISGIIRRDFTLKKDLSEYNQKMLHEIQKAKSVSLHVRRGDYAENAHTKSVHGTCSIEYYRDAVQYMTARVNHPHFFVFSDDIPWCTANLNILQPHTFVYGSDAYQRQQELILMAGCSHHIIANSTFSWWGAWLNNHVEKIVCAPRKWFMNNDHDTRDLLPASWIQIREIS